jgi:hypothetical protein
VAHTQIFERNDGSISSARTIRADDDDEKLSSILGARTSRPPSVPTTTMNELCFRFVP